MEVRLVMYVIKMMGMKMGVIMLFVLKDQLVNLLLWYLLFVM